MRIDFDALDAQLQRKLASTYLLSGDEHLLKNEALDAIKTTARAKGFEDVHTFHVQPGFDWEALERAWREQGLFAKRKLIDLRIPGRFDKGAIDRVRAMVESPSEDVVLILSRPQMDGRAVKSKWVGAFEQYGVHVRIWMLNSEHLPRWLHARMTRLNLQPEREAVTLLAQRVEGNLLAAAQEIDKLLMLRGPGPVSRAEMERYVSDSSRFDVFKVGDAALAGDAARALHMTHRLRAEGIAPVPLSWSLGRDVRLLCQMRSAMDRGQSLEPLFRRNGVWDARKRLLQRAMRRRPARFWNELLPACAHLDQVSKGQAAGDPWVEAERLVVSIAAP